MKLLFLFAPVLSRVVGWCDGAGLTSSAGGGGWSGGAMVLGKLPVPGRPTVLITVGQRPIALAVGAGGGGLDIFTLIYPFSRYRLKYCLKGPLNPKQPTNQHPVPGRSTNLD